MGGRKSGAAGGSKSHLRSSPSGDARAPSPHIQGGSQASLGLCSTPPNDPMKKVQELLTGRLGNRTVSVTPSSDVVHPLTSDTSSANEAPPISGKPATSTILTPVQIVQTSHPPVESAFAARPSPLTNLLMLVAYNGQHFNGWICSNENLRCGHSVMTKCLRKLHGYKEEDKKEEGKPEVNPVVGKQQNKTSAAESTSDSSMKWPALVKGASRTDRGVHAHGQACQYMSFDKTPPFGGDLRRLQRALNSILPTDIRVMCIINAPSDNFHVVRDNEGKEYWYEVDFSHVVEPLSRHTAWCLVEDKQFVGSVFQSIDSASKAKLDEPLTTPVVPISSQPCCTTIPANVDSAARVPCGIPSDLGGDNMVLSESATLREVPAGICEDAFLHIIGDVQATSTPLPSSSFSFPESSQTEPTVLVTGEEMVCLNLEEVKATATPALHQKVVRRLESVERADDEQWIDLGRGEESNNGSMGPRYGLSCVHSHDRRVTGAEGDSKTSAGVAMCGTIRFDWFKVKQAIDVLVGTHDFRAFKAAYHGTEKARVVDSNCTIYGIFVDVVSSPTISDNLATQNLSLRYRFRVVGKRFLYKMIRNIVGALIQIGVGKLSCSDIKAALQEGVLPKGKCIRCAPPEGLVLHAVKFEKDLEKQLSQAKRNYCGM